MHKCAAVGGPAELARENFPTLWVRKRMRGESEKPLSENLIRRCEKLIALRTLRKLFCFLQN
jgi:hypothetical protein